MKKFLLPFLILMTMASSAFGYGDNRVYKIDADTVQIHKSSNPSLWQDYEFGRPTAMASYFEDFYTVTLAQWVITEAGAGTEAITNEANGVLLLTNAAADDNSISMQLGNTADAGTGESFQPLAGRTIYCETKVKISDATESDFLFGLSITDTTPLDSTNLVAFRKDDGSTALKFLTGPTATASLDSNVATVVAATYMVLGFKITGTGLVEYYVNDVKKGSFSTNIPTVTMRPTIHIQNGEAVAKTASVDYVFCSETR